MKPNESERAHLASLLQVVQLTRFNDEKKSAYEAADVNPGTWERAINGLPLRSDVLARIVRAFWPETRGDWRKIPSDDEPAEIEHVLDKYEYISEADRAKILAAARKESPAPASAPRRRKAL